MFIHGTEIIKKMRIKIPDLLKKFMAQTDRLRTEVCDSGQLWGNSRLDVCKIGMIQLGWVSGASLSSNKKTSRNNDLSAHSSRTRYNDLHIFIVS
jgi:hypothetical protein